MESALLSPMTEICFDGARCQLERIVPESSSRGPAAVDVAGGARPAECGGSSERLRLVSLAEVAVAGLPVTISFAEPASPSGDLYPTKRRVPVAVRGGVRSALRNVRGF